MIKKVLLIAAFIIFAVSCSKTPTDPNNGNNNNGNTGDGGMINEGTGTVDPNEIAIFLGKHSGRFYYKSTQEIYVDIRIENSKIYNTIDKTEIKDKIILSGNKLQIETVGNESYGNANDRNSRIYVYDFTDNNNVKLFTKYIFIKENFNKPADYVKIGQISGAGIYAGSYYEWVTGTDYTSIVKDYMFAIDQDGNIYADKSMENVTCSLSGNILDLTFTTMGMKYSYILEANRAIISIYDDNNNMTYQNLQKSDLLTPYIGTYSGNSITLRVDEANADINGIINTSAVLNGNTLIIYEMIYGSSNGTQIKEHKVVFNDNGTATYTKPDGSTVELTKQIV